MSYKVVWFTCYDQLLAAWLRSTAVHDYTNLKPAVSTITDQLIFAIAGCRRFRAMMMMGWFHCLEIYLLGRILS